MSERIKSAAVALQTLMNLGIKPTELEMSNETMIEMIESTMDTVTIMGSVPDFPTTLGKHFPTTFCDIPVRIVE